MTTATVAAGPGQGRSHRLDAALAQLLANAPHMEGASVVSFDGLPMASALPAGMDEDRVAAMSAALLSLGERAAAGLGRGELSQVYVEGDNGTVFLVSADDEAVLVAVASKSAKVGLMLFEAKQAAEAVAAALRADDAELAAVAEVPVAEQVAAEQVAAEPIPVESAAAVPSDLAQAYAPSVGADVVDAVPATAADPEYANAGYVAGDPGVPGTAVIVPVESTPATEPHPAELYAPHTAHAPVEAGEYGVPAHLPESAEAVVAREWAARSNGWV